MIVIISRNVVYERTKRRYISLLVDRVNDHNILNPKFHFFSINQMDSFLIQYRSFAVTFIQQRVIILCFLKYFTT